jgi:hypothetical protein
VTVADNLPARPGVAYAYANWGRWVADCPHPYCYDARALLPGQDGMICQQGHASEVQWPADADAIQALLACRPDPTTRNSRPGETAVDLMLENSAYGIPMVTAGELATSSFVLDVTGSDPAVRLLDEPLVLDTATQSQIGD